MKSIVCQQNDWLLHLRPDLGGCIEGLWFKGQPVLRSTELGQLHSVRQSASYPLIPFSNRLAQAKLHWQGTSHPLVQNFPGEAHSIHGIGWLREWNVLEAEDDFCMLSLEHDGKGAWPFAFDASQTFRLHGNALEMTMSITNQSRSAAPVGLGWHPYFSKRAGAHLSFASQTVWQMGSDNIPVGDAAHIGLVQTIDELTVDNCFSGWNGQASLVDAAMRCEIASDVQHLVVFTTPEKDFVAIEPVSHANNAMNAGNSKESEARGVRILQSGQSWQISMSITVETL
ncbi:MAG: aldose 1-epimerase [Brachymonas sp.]|nr:aldose 1-epimerase [Brachymonas sp.]